LALYRICGMVLQCKYAIGNCKVVWICSTTIITYLLTTAIIQCDVLCECFHPTTFFFVLFKITLSIPFLSFSLFLFYPFFTHFSHSYNLCWVCLFNSTQSKLWTTICIYIYLDKLISFTSSFFHEQHFISCSLCTTYHFTISSSTIYIYTFQSIFFFLINDIIAI
jgi:hypothetical protein